MSKIGIFLNDAAQFELNMDVFNAANKIYNEYPKVSINFFLSNIDWPYKKVEYGFFKASDYQNFNSTTIVTNLEILDYVESIPHNNKMILYCHDFPWTNGKINGKKAVSYLTNEDVTVYSRLEYITDYINSFRIKCSPCKTIGIEELLKRELLS